MEIWTDGRITPDDALLQASAILRHHLDVFVDHDDDQIETDETPEEVNRESARLKKLLNMRVNETELSVRATNCLNNARIIMVGQLATKTEAHLRKFAPEPQRIVKPNFSPGEISYPRKTAFRGAGNVVTPSGVV